MYRILHAHAPPHGRHVVHLPDVRLRARPIATRSKASRTRSARWNSRTTGRSTTGSRRRWASSHPRQIEFARLNLTYTVMSKRKLLELVREKLRHGWDDPRMPTICGLRRRGYTPEAIRDVLRADRRGQGRQRRSTWLCWSTACARTSNARAARDGRAAAAEAGDRRTTRRARARNCEAVNNPEDPAGARARCRSRARCGSSRTTSARCRRRASSASSPGSEVRLR